MGLPVYPNFVGVRDLKGVIGDTKNNPEGLRMNNEAVVSVAVFTIEFPLCPMRG